MSKKTYDVIIVGSGMSGLYTALLLKKYNSDISLLILEKNSREHLGGRANTQEFYGTRIVIGAGIGRLKKDKLLAKLFRYFHIPIHTFDVNHRVAVSKYIDVNKTMTLLKKNYEDENIIDKRPRTFASFAKSALGNAIYDRFIHSAGYTDYIHEDAYETIFEYGIEDNLGGWKAFSVPWRELGESMATEIGMNNFLFNTEVASISHSSDIVTVRTSNKKTIIGKKLVIASTIDTVRKLIPRPIYDDIQGQPFLRVYGKFDKGSSDILRELIPMMTYVDFPIQKIIPMNAEKGVYMIVYNDNENAVTLKSKTENVAETRAFYERLLEKTLRLPNNSLHLLGIRAFYWNIGTHYYKPLKSTYQSREEFIYKAQRPENNIFVVGELISRNQGWTEGALESVEAVIHTLTQKSLI
jgi:hypothetical protein